MPRSALLALALLPCLAGVLFVAYGIERRRRWRVRPGWPRTRAKVIGVGRFHVSTPTSPASQGTMYGVARYIYRYVVAGTEYAAYLEQVPARPRRASRRKGEGQFGVGTTLEVYYDPEAPSRSVPVEHQEWAAPVSLAVGGACLLAAAWIGFEAARRP